MLRSVVIAARFVCPWHRPSARGRTSRFAWDPWDLRRVWRLPRSCDDRCMNQEQFEKVRQGRGFIAALDQSGGSTPKALKLYGVDEDAYSNEAEMFDRI